MFKKIIQAFSKYSQRYSYLKDPKYKRSEVSKPKGATFMPIKSSIPYNIPNDQLQQYHPKVIDIKEVNPHHKEKYQYADLNSILNILNNDSLRQNLNLILWKAVKQLTIHHPFAAKQNFEIFDRAYGVILNNAGYFDTQNFRTLTLISKIYYQKDKQVWSLLFKYSMYFLHRWELQQITFLSKQIEKSQQSTFLYSFDMIMHKVKRQESDIYLISKFLLKHKEEIYGDNVENKNFQEISWLIWPSAFNRDKTYLMKRTKQSKRNKRSNSCIADKRLVCLDYFDILYPNVKDQIKNSITYERYQYKPQFQKFK